VDPACDDATHNGSETDVDCGGNCPPCADGQQCAVGDDCVSKVCSGGLCAAPACDDGAANGAETDTDCGGEACPPCEDGMRCVQSGDCRSRVCLEERCVPATCVDEVLNGAETDIDCGGPECDRCGTGKACSVPEDCVDGVCEDGVCLAPTCEDGVQNGDEVLVDCGGACGEPQTFFLDSDSDGYGDPNQSVIACAPPPGYSAEGTDCNDASAVIRPGVPELCNGIDDNCDGRVDEGCTLVESNFDANTVDGWTIQGDAKDLKATGGALQATDKGEGIAWYFVAPAKFRGDMSAAMGGTFEYRFRVSHVDYDSGEDVTLVGGGITLRFNNPRPSTSWTTYRCPLVPGAGWVNAATGKAATEAEIATVLSNVTKLLILGEHYGSKGDIGYLDYAKLIRAK